MSTAANTYVVPDRLGVFIDNRWVESDSDRWLEVVDPSSALVVARVREASRGNVDAAVTAAQRAFGSWSVTSPAERAAWLDRMADVVAEHERELAELVTMEMGMPLSATPALVRSAVNSFRYYASLARSYEFTEERERIGDGGLTRVEQEPVGVVASIIPWNGPVASMGSKLAPALAAGCTVVFKPAPSTPLALYRAAELFAEIGLPPGVVNMLAADREISEYLATHPGVDKIAFTGSTAAGKRLMELAARHMKRINLELGGKSAAIVLDDAPLDDVVPVLVGAGCFNTGQVCAALTRVLVSDARHDQLVAAMTSAYQAIRIGDARDPATTMGPLAMERQQERVEGYIKLATEEGAHVVTGGGRPAQVGDGFYIEPTLLSGVDNSMRIAQEEIFGPVIAIITYRDEAHAIELANDSEYGLSGAVFSADEQHAIEVARKIRTGTISINTYVITAANTPFGGYKFSGQGREGGPDGLKLYLETKAINLPSRAT